MEIDKNLSDEIDEGKSLLVIKEMIEVSKNKIKKDGILFIVWGWALFFVSIIGFLERSFTLSFSTIKILNILATLLPLLALIFSIYYLIRESKKVQTYIGISLRYVWFSLFACMVLVNLIQFNVLQSINFELQHPIFMIMMAFATIVSGGILRYRLIIIGGVIFAIMALIASYLSLKEQLLIESAAWAIAFIIPGHILYAKRKK